MEATLTPQQKDDQSIMLALLIGATAVLQNVQEQHERVGDATTQAKYQLMARLLCMHDATKPSSHGDRVRIAGIVFTANQLYLELLQVDSKGYSDRLSRLGALRKDSVALQKLATKAFLVSELDDIKKRMAKIIVQVDEEPVLAPASEMPRPCADSPIVLLSTSPSPSLSFREPPGLTPAGEMPRPSVSAPIELPSANPNIKFQAYVVQRGSQEHADLVAALSRATTLD